MAVSNHQLGFEIDELIEDIRTCHGQSNYFNRLQHNKTFSIHLIDIDTLSTMSF